MRPSKKYINESIHETNNCGQLEIIEYLDVNHRRVRFLSTGYTTVVTLAGLSSGRVRDPYAPILFGVAYLGEPEEHPLRKVIEVRWRAMLNRVYGIKTGKTVDPSWLCFANFLRDVIELNGIELLYSHSKENRIDLDSDIIAKEKGIPPNYSKETCQWVPKTINNRARELPKKYTKRPIGTVIETKHGPVTIIAKDKQKWLIRFSDGTEKWVWQIAVLNDMFAKPATPEE